MLVRMAVIGFVIHLVVSEVVLRDTTFASERNWWSYVVQREFGFDRLERAFADFSRR